MTDQRDILPAVKDESDESRRLREAINRLAGQLVAGVRQGLDSPVGLLLVRRIAAGPSLADGVTHLARGRQHGGDGGR